MSNSIPTVPEVKMRLMLLSHAGIQELARESNVPFTTIWNIRCGATANTGMETVRKFWTVLAAAGSAPSKEAA